MARRFLLSEDRKSTDGEVAFSICHTFREELERFCEEYVDGALYTDLNSTLLRTFLGHERALEVEMEAIFHLRSGAGSSRLAKLGQLALAKMPELLSHFSSRVRLIARDALKELLLGPVESYTEWLAYHGLVLPVEDGPTPAEVEELHKILCDYLRRAALWSDPRFLTWWQILSRSDNADVANQAVDSVARAYLNSPHQSLLETMLLALNHPEQMVRRAALLRLGSHVDHRGWAPAFHSRPSPEAGLMMVARRFAEGDPDLEQAWLQQGLEKLVDWRLNDCQFFVPDNPERLLTILDLSGRSASCDAAIRRLIWCYRGRTPANLWKRLQALSLDFSQSNLHRPLAERWPRLVLHALRSREDWLEWVLSLGIAAKTGLRQALNHKEPAFRLQGLAVLAAMQQGFSDYFRTVLEMSKSDPDPEVQKAAKKLLDPKDKQ